MIALQIIGVICLLFACVFGVIYLGTVGFTLLHRRRYPQDAVIYDLALRAMKETPEKFTVISDSSLTAKGLCYTATYYGSLRSNGVSVNLSSLQQERIKKAIKALWDRQDRKDPRKEDVLRKMGVTRYGR